jgi:hypothetical protein
MNDDIPRPRKSRRKEPSVHSKDPIDLARHRRKCQICNHPCRELIEECFIHWHPNWRVIEKLKLDTYSFYRHVVAFDLYAKRKQNLRSSIEHILERGVEVPLTGDTILRAVKAYTCLTDDNQWIEPASRVIFSKSQPEAPPSQKTIERAALAEVIPAIDDETDRISEQEANSNNGLLQLETEPTY